MSEKFGFMRIETYGFVNHGKKSARTIYSVIGDAVRMKSYCRHVKEPLEPIILHGEPKNVPPRLRLAMQQAKVDGYKIRKDSQLLIAMVISYPEPVSKMRHVLDHWRETGEVLEEAEQYALYRKLYMTWLKGRFGNRIKGILEHFDEEYPHAHIFICPKLEIGETLRDLHPGFKAFDDTCLKTQSDRHKAYRTAMQAFQDEFFDAVGGRLGWGRNKGVKRVSRRMAMARKTTTSAQPKNTPKPHP